MTDVYFATVASSHIHPQHCGRLWKLLDLVVYRWVLRSRLGRRRLPKRQGLRCGMGIRRMGFPGDHKSISCWNLSHSTSQWISFLRRKAPPKAEQSKERLGHCNRGSADIRNDMILYGMTRICSLGPSLLYSFIHLLAIRSHMDFANLQCTIWLLNLAKNRRHFSTRLCDVLSVLAEFRVRLCWCCFMVCWVCDKACTEDVGQGSGEHGNHWKPVEICWIHSLWKSLELVVDQVTGIKKQQGKRKMDATMSNTVQILEVVLPRLAQAVAIGVWRCSWVFRTFCSGFFQALPQSWRCSAALLLTDMSCFWICPLFVELQDVRNSRWREEKLATCPNSTRFSSEYGGVAWILVRDCESFSRRTSLHNGILA